MEQSVQPCPECGAEIRTDPRFTTWCAACDWNVDPGKPEEEPGRLERLRRQLARRHGERLFAEVAADGAPSSRRDAAGLLAYGIALAVHGVTLALLIAGILLVVLGWGGPLPVVGVFFLMTTWFLRPRLGRLPADEPVLYRDAAPQLFALIDEVAAVVGTKGVHAIVVTPAVNASVTTYGIRGRRLLKLGLGLWEITGPQQRIALLGHELGHYTNGDLRHGPVIANALRSLNMWLYLMEPIRNPTPLEMILNVGYFLPRSAILGLTMALDQLTLRATQRAEYLADSLAARAGSTEAAVGLTDRLLVAHSAESTLLREANAGQVVRGKRAARAEAWRGLWERLAAHMDSIPEGEHERQRRLGALRGHSVDSTHPPTHLRRASLLAGAPVPAAVHAEAGRQAAIAAELAASRERLARLALQL
ncbi:M48 family metallopeptidase [Streptomyces celluloflavus]|uniref:M48 family metallopeptidase n=1 Tax=Streptomyces celluloflavus TaxID=58344 RepID=UPI0036B4147C